MNELPRSVRIGPIDYTVELVPDLMLEKGGEVVYLNGHILLDEEKILIDAGLSHRQAVVTLWHEIFHAILGQAGSEAAFDESIVRPLGYGLLDVATNNPRLLETLRERKQGDTGMDMDIEFTGTYEDVVAALSAIVGDVEGVNGVYEFEYESAPGSEVPAADLVGVQEVDAASEIAREHVPDETGCWDDEDAEYYGWDDDDHISGCHCWACRGQS